MNKISSKALFFLMCIVTLVTSGFSANATEIKTYKDGEIIVLDGGTEKGAKNYSISVLFWHESPNDFTALQGIIEGLRIIRLPCTLTIRQALEDEQKVQSIIAELKSSPPDLIYVMGTEISKRVMLDIHDTPIVFTAVSNPVLSGITQDWSSSGRNIAGNSSWISIDTILEVFTKTVPVLKTLGVMYSPANVVSSMEVAAIKKIFRQRNRAAIELVEIKVKNVNDLQPACQLLVEKGVDAIWIPNDILVYKNLYELTSTAISARIPILSSSHRGVENGSMIGLVIDYALLGKKSVVIANKILFKRVAPQDIPIGTMSNVHIIINLKAAGLIGYEIPLGVLASADVIVE